MAKLTYCIRDFYYPTPTMTWLHKSNLSPKTSPPFIRLEWLATHNNACESQTPKGQFVPITAGSHWLHITMCQCIKRGLLCVGRTAKPSHSWNNTLSRQLSLYSIQGCKVHLLKYCTILIYVHSFSPDFYILFGGMIVILYFYIILSVHHYNH